LGKIPSAGQNGQFRFGLTAADVTSFAAAQLRAVGLIRTRARKRFWVNCLLRPLHGCWNARCLA